SEFGVHIIKVTDKRESEEDIGSFKENKDEIRRELINQKVDFTEAQNKIDQLMEDAKIEVNIDEYEDLFKTGAEEDKEDEKDDEKDKEQEFIHDKDWQLKQTDHLSKWQGV